MDRAARTKPSIYFRVAGEFAELATRAAGKTDFDLPELVFAFAANADHAIELYLKSFLLSKGVAASDLKKFGHKLADLSDEAVSRGLTLSDDDRASVAFLANLRAQEAWRYPIEGHLPGLDAKAVLDLIDRIRAAVR
jgi:hypothetical protein